MGWITLGWVGLMGFLSCGAQTPTPAVSPVSILPPVKLEVSWVKQENPNLCGLAALEMLTHFYNQKLNQTQEDWLRTTAGSGSGLKGLDLVTVLRAADYETAVFPGTLSGDESTGLFFHLKKGRPMILMITSKDGHNSHYDVVTGFDQKQGQLFVVDPAIGSLNVPIKDFTLAWDRAKNFTLLAMPKSLVELQSTPTETGTPGSSRK